VRREKNLKNRPAYFFLSLKIGKEIKKTMKEFQSFPRPTHSPKPNESFQRPFRDLPAPSLASIQFVKSLKNFFTLVSIRKKRMAKNKVTRPGDGSLQSS